MSKEEHPFFRAMVVMGSTMAVGCGGVVKDGQSSGTGAAPGASESSDSGGASSLSPRVGTGARSSTGSAGTPMSAPSNAGSSGTAMVSGFGGSSGAAMVSGFGGSSGTVTSVPVEPPLDASYVIVNGSGAPPSSADPGASDADASAPPACPSSQWDCSAFQLNCDGDSTGWRVPDQRCACDPRRPKSAADCGKDLSFVCRVFARGADGQSLPERIAFQCACVSSPSDCQATCRTLYQSSGLEGCVGGMDGNYLCGCAVVSLR